MGTDKEKLSQLIERIDEILSVINQISEDLKSLSLSIKSITQKQVIDKPMVPAQSKTTVAQPPKKESLIANIRANFGELEKKLNFEEKQEYIIIKPKQFLGSDIFAKIASIVRSLEGEYISAGKDSHFRVYKKPDKNN